MRLIIVILISLNSLSSCQSQNKQTNLNNVVGGPCEGCEAVFEYGDKKLTSTDTLPDFEQNNPKLKLTGIVYEKDGITPAKSVILYIYQTDRNGIYVKKGNEKAWAKRHGYIRGWIQTDKTGRYTFYTFRPAAYPSGKEPEHIHVTVKESNKNEYYIDEFVFDDDLMLGKNERNDLEN